MQNDAKRHGSAKRRGRSQSDRRTILWLILCFPYGLYRMWRGGCRWSGALKCLVSAACLALVVGIIAIPSPGVRKAGSIRIVATERDVEVFGPQLPESAPEDYAFVPVKTVLSTASETGKEPMYVYCAKDAQCYHMVTCKYAYASSQRLTVYEATLQGYTPCKLCKAPTLEEAEASASAADATDEPAASAPAEGEAS